MYIEFLSDMLFDFAAAAKMRSLYCALWSDSMFSFFRLGCKATNATIAAKTLCSYYGNKAYEKLIKDSPKKTTILHNSFVSICIYMYLLLIDYLSYWMVSRRKPG